MDGNGRWAKARMLPRIMGHRKGVQTVKAIVEECSELGIRFLTLYAFSAENWLRPKTEVTALMALLKKYIKAEVPKMMRNNIRFRTIGNLKELPGDIQAELENAISETASNNGMTLTLALSYGGRQELVNAAKSFAAKVIAGEDGADDLDESAFASFLYTDNIPDPDLLIRTGGEMRISNFLLWQLAYSELYFTETSWPEFSLKELYKALLDYQARERRFGLTGEQVRNLS
jgi:undecaprenyl diphosphate synthase